MKAPDDQAQPAPSPHAWLALAVIVIVAGAMRFSGLENRPAGLFRDEAEKGYNAWALMTSGGVVEFRADVPGGPLRPVFRRWPWIVDVMGSPTPALYHAVATPFVYALGLSIQSTRMPAALAGTLAVALIGAVLLRVWPARAALAAALWLSLCPWHYVFSRWAVQGAFVPLGLAGALAGSAGIQGGKKWGFPFLGFSLGFTFYSYSGAGPVILAFAVFLAGLYFRRLRQEWAGVLIGAGFFIAWVAPTIIAMVSSGGTGRLDRVAVWNAPDATVIKTGGRMLMGWLAHYNPIFLFISGDSLPRHAIPGVGQLLLTDAVLLPAGIWASYRKQMTLRHELLGLFLCAPLGAAITWGHIPHALRALPMVVPCAVWSGLGLVTIGEWIATRARKGESSRANILQAAMMLACAVYALRIFALYWSLYGSDPRITDRENGFSLSYEQAFSALGRHVMDNPEARSGVNARIPYAPYYLLFHTELPPEAVRDKFEGGSIMFFDPRIVGPGGIMRRLRPGDCWVDFDSKGEAQFWLRP